jgi:hypothetical protein
LKFLGQTNGLFAIGCFSYNPQIWLLFQQFPGAGTDDRMIVSQDQPDFSR